MIRILSLFLLTVGACATHERAADMSRNPDRVAPTGECPAIPGAPSAAITKSSVLKTIMASKQPVEDCCARLAGELVSVSWDVDCDGTTKNIWVNTTSMRESDIGPCVTQAVAAWRFEPYVGTRAPQVTFPFKCGGKASKRTRGDERPQWPPTSEDVERPDF